MDATQLCMDFQESSESGVLDMESLKDSLLAFDEFGKRTIFFKTEIPSIDLSIDTYVNEFWTSKQRASHSLHEVSYRACFKAQLPRFFIERLTEPGDVVYDPFMGRGTSLLEAALMGRVPYGCDINPLSASLIRPRLTPPNYDSVKERLDGIDLTNEIDVLDDLLVFYEKNTLREMCNLRKYLIKKDQSHGLDNIDQWIRMVAINRLTGHSPGFFSVYTLPPNQAVSVASQRKINEQRQQVPTYRNVKNIILKKTKSLLSDCVVSSYNFLQCSPDKPRILTSGSAMTPEIPSGSVSLVVTSPPFLDIVNYEQDNWLRCWFLGIDPKNVEITMEKGLDGWKHAMTAVFQELYRMLKPGGYVAFEVGEVRGGKIKLEESVVPCGHDVGLEPCLILINDQIFTKTANCWGVDNNSKGTNTNRIVLFRKPTH